MRRGLKASILAIAAIFAFASAAAAKPSVHHVAKHSRHIHRVRHTSHVGYLPLGASGRGSGYVELVGDPESGVGFYALPYRYRVGAWRYRMRDRTPPWIKNGVLYAMMADSARYHYYWATPVDSYRYGVYDPFAGVGTPFFAGYYGPAGDDDEPSFPFGRPYQ